MPTTSASAGGFISGRIRLRTPVRAPRWFSRLATAVAVTITVGAASSAVASPVLEIGSVATFAAGPDEQGGHWTLGDKDFQYLADSGNWSGDEAIRLLENANPALLSHQFLIDNMSGYDSPITLSLDYQVHINGSSGPYHFHDVFLGSIMSGPTVEVWKDVFSSLADYIANTNGWHLYALNGVDGGPTSAVFPGGLTDLWVRDTIKLSGLGGSVSSINNTFRQEPVPEIDPASFGSVLALVLGAFSFLERRTRRVLGMPAVA